MKSDESRPTHIYKPLGDRMRVKAKHFEPRSYYHIYNHAARNNMLFKDTKDYEICLYLFRQYLNRPNFSVVASCLMPNHYHFLIRQNGDNPVFLPLNKVWYRYSRYYNKRYGERGSIFAGKMNHIAVDDEYYLLRLVAYIHQNPVSANLVSSVADWPWSNYPEWTGLRDKELWDKDICNEMHFRLGNADLMDESQDDNKFRSYTFGM